MARSTAAARTRQTLLLLVCIVKTATSPLVSAALNLKHYLRSSTASRDPACSQITHLSAWSTTAGGETLNSKNPIFYNGAELGWEGLLIVDGVAYEYLGTGAQELPGRGHTTSAIQIHLQYDRQWSNFIFTAEPLEVDGKPHDVKLYSDIQGVTWLDPAGRAPVKDVCFNACSACSAENPTVDPVPIWVIRLAKETALGEAEDRATWGNLTYASSNGSAPNFLTTSCRSTDLRSRFLNLRMQNMKSTEAVDPDPAYAFIHIFPNATEGGALYTIGFSQQPAIQYLTASGLAPLNPWWIRCHRDLYVLVEDHYREFSKVSAMAAAFEAQLLSDIQEYYKDASLTTNVSQQGGTISAELATEAQNYYSIVALSARQVIGAYVLTEPPDSIGTFKIDPSKPWMWQKEISSNGNMNTVDVIYPAMPFFLYANSELLSYFLTPLYAFQSSGFYPDGWIIHDLGAHYPNATGHVADHDEPIPVEESANMMIMSLAYAQFSDQTQAKIQDLYFYDIWKQWAEYLVKYTLIPESQLSTDDFARTLHNQTNLAIKGVVALEAMNVISRAVNKSEWLSAHKLHSA